jgi:hypothetical protein
MEQATMLLKIIFYVCVWLFGLKTTKVQVECSYEQSDHASLYMEFHINEEILMGPGLKRVNAPVLEDPCKLNVAKEEIKEMIAQIPDNWVSHKRL